MARLLRESIGSVASGKEIEQWVEVAIARQLGLGDSLPSNMRTRELDRLSDLAYEETFMPMPSGAIDVAAYAAAVRATREFASRLYLTPIGRVFLELKGRDAARWLLYVEIAQSFGPSDDWRVDRDTARCLLRKDVWLEPEDFPGSWKTLGRLDALGIIRVHGISVHGYRGFDITPLGRQLLAEVADVKDSPMSILAESILSDLTLSVASSAMDHGGAASTLIQRNAVVEATVRHSRLVAHEVRNMLVPVKTALGALYREVLLTEQPGEVIARRREVIDGGIESIFRFVGQLVELSQFVAAPPEPFDILSAIRDAISTVATESGRSIEQVLPATLPPISGHRARVVMALTNVLRNASQAASSVTSVIRVEAESLEGASAVRISIDDNGPGVPESMRRAIFEEGVSLRGGSGLGLALVREVFEKEMRGLVACEASSLGGARFVIRVPATGAER